MHTRARLAYSSAWLTSTPVSVLLLVMADTACASCGGLRPSTSDSHAATWAAVTLGGSGPAGEALEPLPVSSAATKDRNTRSSLSLAGSAAGTTPDGQLAAQLPPTAIESSVHWVHFWHVAGSRGSVTAQKRPALQSCALRHCAPSLHWQLALQALAATYRSGRRQQRQQRAQLPGRVLNGWLELQKLR